ncbi:MAG TPA: hypothetical protein VEH29_10285 [Acidimicrobiales bacterium]|nr:hypothetical protein [Acidimicrobiales bacterium]
MTGGQAARDWVEWHRPYDEPGSALAARLVLVQAHIRQALDEAPPGEVRLVSMCAGQGRDVIGALGEHPRKADVRARLVELDPRNAALAREQADAADLPLVEVVTGDASVSDAYLGAAPAHVVLACGIFGNISEGDIHRCVGLLPMLCAPAATVVWTRHRRPPDLTPQIRTWFAAAGFEEIAHDELPDLPYVGVGAHRWRGEGGVVRRGVGFFRFDGDGTATPSRGG